MNWPARSCALHLGLVVLLDGRLGALDQGQDVAHAEDPRRHAIGVEHLERVELLAGRRELDRLAGDRLDAERGAAAGVAVELRQDHTVERDALVERLGDVDGFLAGHRVDDEDHVLRLRLVAHPLELGHQLVVDLQAARGVDDDGVETRFARAGDAAPRRLDGVLRVGPEDRDLNLRAELLELVDRGGTLQVGRDQPGLPALAAQVQRELGGGRRLARALQAGEQDDRELAEREARLALTHQLRQLVVDDLHDLLAGSQALQHRLAERLLADAGDEVTDDGEVDVGFEQREPDLAHRTRDRLLVERSLLPEVAEGALQLVGEAVEHDRAS